LYASQIEVDMIEFSDEEIVKLQEVAPYFTKIVIPKETYPQQDRDLNVFGMKASLIADAAVEDDIVYKMLEVVYLKKLASIQEQHGALKTLVLEEALKGLSGAPLHPGAVKFYQDNGVEVPERLLPSE
jgi:TRAP transporter TAXI family solute receptor